MAKRPDTSWRIITSTLKLADAQGWRSVTLEEIAADAKVTMDELYALFPNKIAILSGFNRRIDAQCLKDTVFAAESASPGETSGETIGEPVKDQLFELMMNRFDAMQAHKSALGSILKDTVITNPPASLSALCSARRSMKLTLRGAGDTSKGPLGRLKVKILTGIYIATVRVWLGDGSKDLAKTMAALDKSLSRAERFAGCFHRQPAPE